MITRTLRTLTAVCLLGALLAACGSGSTPGPMGNTLVDVFPLEGTSAGGTEVTLTGTGFSDPTFLITVIRFGEAIVETWEIVSDTTIVCIAPPGPLGSTVVTLWADVGSKDPLLTGGYRYVALTLYTAHSSASPDTNLFKIDLDSGNVGLVGAVGFPVAALATRPEGTIYGAEDGPLRRLIRIDPATGVGVPVANLRDAMDQPVDLRDMTFFGSRLLGRTAAGEAVEIDLALGSVTPLPPIPGAGTGPGIATRDLRLCYLTDALGDQIRGWEPATNVTIPGPLMASLDVMSVDALEYFADTLFGVSFAPGTGASNLVSVSPFTGQVTTVVALPAGCQSLTRDL